MNEFIEFAKIVGPTAAILCVIVWQLFKKMKETDDFVRGRLTQVLEENTRAMTKLDLRIKNRPCLIDADEDSQERHTPLAGLQREAR